MDQKQKSNQMSDIFNSWQILCELESSIGNTSNAQMAKESALQTYLAWRRSGAENNTENAELMRRFEKGIREQWKEEYFLTLLAEGIRLTERTGIIIDKLMEILWGSSISDVIRDKNLLYYEIAELLLLMERIHTIRR